MKCIQQPANELLLLSYSWNDNEKNQRQREIGQRWVGAEHQLLCCCVNQDGNGNVVAMWCCHRPKGNFEKRRDNKNFGRYLCNLCLPDEQEKRFGRRVASCLTYVEFQYCTIF